MTTNNRRTVVVSGGATGIGLAIATRFAHDGESVILLGRRRQKLEEAAHELQRSHPASQVLWHGCDVGSPEDVEAFVRWLADGRHAPVNVVVNNAGGVTVGADESTLAGVAAADYELLGGNLVGAHLLTHALRPYLARPGGRIINISSIAAVRGGGGMYSAAKAGVIGLTYALAGELAAEGITVNAVAPGLVLDTEFFGGGMTGARLESRLAQIPLGRAGRPDDIAAAVHYLASDEASYVTGQVHHVNGGWAFGR